MGSVPDASPPAMPLLSPGATAVAALEADASDAKGHVSASAAATARVEARLFTWYRSAWHFTLVLLAAIGVLGGVFLYAHTETEPTRRVRKLFFVSVYVPLYVLVSLLVVATRNHPELNDVVTKAAYCLLGAAASFIGMTSFNTVLLALNVN